MSKGDSVSEDVAREALRSVVDALTGLERRLVVIHGSLPVAASMAGAIDDDLDVATEIRSVIDCVLTDSIRPAIRDLQAAASYTGKPEGRRRSTGRDHEP
jgi:hypothetical protein